MQVHETPQKKLPAAVFLRQISQVFEFLSGVFAICYHSWMEFVQMKGGLINIHNTDRNRNRVPDEERFHPVTPLLRFKSIARAPVRKFFEHYLCSIKRVLSKKSRVRDCTSDRKGFPYMDLDQGVLRNTFTNRFVRNGVAIRIWHKLI